MFPRLVKIRQNIATTEITNVRQGILKELERININGMNLSGCTVGITAGSQGINELSEIMKTVIEAVKGVGGIPIIIPAMGSHGGGTEEGQREVLNSLGITKEAMGAPVCACTESIQIGETQKGMPVFINREAAKVDRLILLYRIKQHTGFSGKIESGIHKIVTIGLGGPRGASTAHYYAMKYGYEEAITSIAEVGIKKLPIIFAVGILENWKGKTAQITAMLPEEIREIEELMLEKDKAQTIKIPFSDIDVLIVGEIGKNVCSGGMDSKIVGRIRLLRQSEPENPKINRIVVLNLTPESHGNACGIGLADFIPRRVFEAINIDDTVFNCVTSMAPEYACIPAILKNDLEVLTAAVRTSCPESNEMARIVYIKNTSRLEEIFVSESMLEEVIDNKQLEIIGSPEKFMFDEKGDLINFKDVL